jgi:3-hydroxyisobutyrate dehydrogenase
MMYKDLKLSQAAAAASQADTDMGKRALDLYEKFINSGNGEVDFSGIIQMIRGQDR